MYPNTRGADNIACVGGDYAHFDMYSLLKRWCMAPIKKESGEGREAEWSPRAKTADLILQEPLSGNLLVIMRASPRLLWLLVEFPCNSESLQRNVNFPAPRFSCASPNITPSPFVLFLRIFIVSSISAQPSRIGATSSLAQAIKQNCCYLIKCNLG